MHPKKPTIQISTKSGPTNRATWQRLYAQFLERARAAKDAGNPIDAENFYQHADHYFRMMVGAAA